MIAQSFNISQYDWNIKVYYDVERSDINFCIKQLKKLTTDNKIFNECKQTLDTKYKDRAYTYSSYVVKSSIVFIGIPSSTGELINTITHEANHIKSHIATYYDLNEKGEKVSYLIGKIVKEMSNTFIRFICNNCLDY